MTEHMDFRGFHIIVINPQSGKVKFSKVFDTIEHSEGIDEFLEDDTMEGDIIVAACAEDIKQNLSEDAIKWFQSMGSKEIDKVGVGHSFAFIGRIDALQPCNEMRGQTDTEEVSVVQWMQVNKDYQFQFAVAVDDEATKFRKQLEKSAQNDDDMEIGDTPNQP